VQIIAQKYDFQFISDYNFSLSFAYLSVLSAPADLCKKLKFYDIRFLYLSGVPLNITNVLASLDRNNAMNYRLF
jgi:hypothetical protein